MIKKISILTLLFVFFNLHLNLFGVYTKKIEITFSPQMFSDETKTSNISIYYQDGGISLSYGLENIFNGSEAFVSWIEKLNDTNVIVSTVNPNNIYIYNNSKFENAGSFPNHSMITKIKVIDNSLYILTGEKGSIYLLNSLSSEPMVSFEDSSYVWDLFKFKGKIYAITGNKACIYEINKNSYKKIFESDSEKHFIVALVDGDKVYIGSSGTGTIYTFDGNQLKPLLSLKDTEITDIKKYGKYLVVSTYNITPTQQNSQQNKSTQPSPLNILRSTQGNIYLIDPTTKREELLLQEVGITSIEILGNTLLASTIDGKLVEYSFDDKKYKYSFYNKTFLKIFKFQNDLYLTSANPSGIDFVNSSRISESGFIETQEIEVGKVSSWGRIKYEGSIPSETSVKFLIKGGNTPKEDSSWSDWVEVKEFINFEKYQYVKLRVYLYSKNPKVSPTVKSISIFYTPQNSSPSVSEFKVSNQGDFLNFEWKSSDPDGDKVQFNLFAKNYNEIEWQKITKDPIIDNKFSLNRYLLGNGVFDFLITVDDSPSNPKEFARYNSNIIEKYIVDITPPYLDRQSIKITKNDFVFVEFKVGDNFGLKEVQYSIDGINWSYILPEDGVVDSVYETFRISVRKEYKTLLLKITDEFGNITTERISL